MNEINNIPESASEIGEKLQELAGSRIISTKSDYGIINHTPKDVEVGSGESLEKGWLDIIQGLNPEKVGENVKENVEQTHKSLLSCFQKAEKKLGNIGLNSQKVASACIDRLLIILGEVSQGKRNLTNGDVLCLSSIKDGQLNTRTIGYYEFACCNVSLDQVQIQGKTLREISNDCEDTNDSGDFLLPNSFGVSISLMAEDESLANDKSGKPVFIGQFRNNANTLTQRDATKVVSAASGAIDPGKDILDMGRLELSEELGIDSERKKISNQVLSLMTGEQISNSFQIGNILYDELGVEDASIEIGGIVFEDFRRNPELVLRAKTKITTQEIESLWQKAKDRGESTGIRGVDLQEIGDNISGEKDTLEKHFLQSLLAWYIQRK